MDSPALPSAPPWIKKRPCFFVLNSTVVPAPKTCSSSSKGHSFTSVYFSYYCTTTYLLLPLRSTDASAAAAVCGTYTSTRPTTAAAAVYLIIYTRSPLACAHTCSTNNVLELQEYDVPQRRQKLDKATGLSTRDNHLPRINHIYPCQQ